MISSQIHVGSVILAACVWLAEVSLASDFGVATVINYQLRLCCYKWFRIWEIVTSRQNLHRGPNFLYLTHIGAV